MEIWRVTRPEYEFEAPSADTLSQITARFSVRGERVLYCSQKDTTALRETLQLFYNRKRSTKISIPTSWARQHSLLKGLVVAMQGPIIDIETPLIQRELDLYLGRLLDKYSIPHIDTGVLRGNFPEITHAISDWVFHKRKAAGLLYRSKFESNGICYAVYSSRVKVKLLESIPLNSRSSAVSAVCKEYNLKMR